jgi:hypothetical protein
MIGRDRISRRTVLRGAGVAVALPLLEAMLPRARSAEAKPPVRLAFVYVPNGIHMPDWTPRTAGPNFELPPILRPLQAVKDDLLVLSGLTLDPARAHGDGGGDHARAMASFLTGRHPEKSSGARLRAGISIDQVAAAKVGIATRFPSLEIGCEGGNAGATCDHGYSCAYQTNLSWRGESAPAAKEIDPRLVFERLFGNGAEANAARARRERESRGILDFVLEDTKQLVDRIGSADRRKLDEYLSSVRELERRITRLQPAASIGDEKFVRPPGVPVDYREHVRLMCDLLVLAFRADLTRIATFVFANDGSNRDYPEAGVADGHHDLTHHGGDSSKQERIRRINTFHAEQFAYLLNRLRSVPEGDGNLLDRSMIVYGSGISDGNAHSHDNLPILLAGKGGGTINPGRHIIQPRETPLTNLWLSLLDRLGISAESFGDSTGLLGGLER